MIFRQENFASTIDSSSLGYALLRTLFGIIGVWMHPFPDRTGTDSEGRLGVRA